MRTCRRFGSLLWPAASRSACSRWRSRETIRRSRSSASRSDAIALLARQAGRSLACALVSLGSEPQAEAPDGPIILAAVVLSTLPASRPEWASNPGGVGDGRRLADRDFRPVRGPSPPARRLGQTLAVPRRPALVSRSGQRASRSRSPCGWAVLVSGALGTTVVYDPWRRSAAAQCLDQPPEQPLSLRRPGLYDGLNRLGVLLCDLRLEARRSRAVAPRWSRRKRPSRVRRRHFAVSVTAGSPAAAPSRAASGSDRLPPHRARLGRLGAGARPPHRSAVARLVVELGESAAGGLRDALASASPIRRSRSPTWSARVGLPMPPGSRSARHYRGRVVTPLVRDGRPVAVLMHRQGLLDTPEAPRRGHIGRTPRPRERASPRPGPRAARGPPAPRAPASSRQATTNAAASSGTSTTGRNSDWWDFRSDYDSCEGGRPGPEARGASRSRRTRSCTEP